MGMTGCCQRSFTCTCQMESSLTEVSYNLAFVQTVQQAMSQVRVIIVPDQSKYQQYEGVKIYFKVYRLDLL